MYGGLRSKRSFDPTWWGKGVHITLWLLWTSRKFPQAIPMLHSIFVIHSEKLGNIHTQIYCRKGLRQTIISGGARSLPARFVEGPLRLFLICSNLTLPLLPLLGWPVKTRAVPPDLWAGPSMKISWWRVWKHQIAYLSNVLCLSGRADRLFTSVSWRSTCISLIAVCIRSRLLWILSPSLTL